MRSSTKTRSKIVESSVKAHSRTVGQHQEEDGGAAPSDSLGGGRVDQLNDARVRRSHEKLSIVTERHGVDQFHGATLGWDTGEI